MSDVFSKFNRLAQIGESKKEVPINKHILYTESIKRCKNGKVYAIVKEGQRFYVKESKIQKENLNDYKVTDFYNITNVESIQERFSSYPAATHRIIEKVRHIDKNTIMKESDEEDVDDMSDEADSNDGAKGSEDSSNMTNIGDKSGSDDSSANMDTDAGSETEMGDSTEGEEETISLQELAGKMPSILEAAEGTIEEKKSAINQLIGGIIDFAKSDEETFKAVKEYIEGKLSEEGEESNDSEDVNIDSENQDGEMQGGETDDETEISADDSEMETGDSTEQKPKEEAVKHKTAMKIKEEVNKELKRLREERYKLQLERLIESEAKRNPKVRAIVKALNKKTK